MEEKSKVIDMKAKRIVGIAIFSLGVGALVAPNGGASFNGNIISSQNIFPSTTKTLFIFFPMKTN